jgi:hypothetical protein
MEPAIGTATAGVLGWVAGYLEESDLKVQRANGGLTGQNASAWSSFRAFGQP